MLVVILYRMDALSRARSLLREMKAEEAELEDQVIAALHQYGTKATAIVVEIESKISELKARQEEQSALIAYYEDKLQDSIASSGAEVYMLAYQSTRIEASLMSHADADESLSRRVLRWSERNAIDRITGLLVATKQSFFGVIEGPAKEGVEAKLAQIINDGSSWHQDCTVLFGQYISARMYPVGLVLRFIEDELLGDFVDAIRRRGLGATHYASRESLRVLCRGGDPQNMPPDIDCTRVILCARLDQQCGAVHTAESYDNAAALIAQWTEEQGGDVIERFGEHMVSTFPLNGGPTPATNVVGIAEKIYREIPFSIVGIHLGRCSMVSSPQLSAFGPAVRDAIRLAEFAESERRPMLLTPIVHDRTSKAVHQFTTFTIDNVRYYALRCVGEKRLPVPAPPVMGEVYDPTWMDPVPADRTNTIAHQYRGIDEQEEQKVVREPLVKGALTMQEMKAMFRELDVGNVGWIGKAKFRQAVEHSGKFPIFAHDLKKVDKWLQTHNKLGKERLSFEEFAIMCLKMEQM